MDFINEKLKFYSPLRYPGGKQILFPFIKELINENGFVNLKYSEPYAGGCGLALKLLFENVVEELYLNDFDANIYAFWLSILEYNEEFCKWIYDVPVTIDQWNLSKEILTHSENYSTFEIAKAVFFLNRCNVSGVLKGGLIGGKMQGGKYKMDARFNKEDLIRRILKIAEKKDKIHFYNLDALEFLEITNNIDNLFTYLDPPYVEKGSELYLNFYKKQDHKLLANYLEKNQISFILSYDNSELVRRLYQYLDIYKFNIAQSTSNRIGNEIIIFSENIEYSRSINFLKNAEKISIVGDNLLSP